MLSPSTEKYDRNEKLIFCQTLDSLQEYILVSQSGIGIAQHIRHDHKWILREFHSLDDVLVIASIECKIALRAIYAKVKLTM